MLTEAQRVRHRVATVSLAELGTNDDLVAASAWRLAVIGEAAGRISVAYRQQHPEIPWLQIVGMRNRLIHGYDAIDLEVVWSTVQNDLPNLVSQLATLIGD